MSRENVRIRLPRSAYAQHALLRQGALGLLYPRRCPFCDEVVGMQPECEACAPRLRALRLAQQRLAPETHYFGNLDGAAAVFHYDGAVRDALLRMKYQGCRWYGRDLGNLMAQGLFGCTFEQKYGILTAKRAFAGVPAYDVVVPVPKSNAARGYNVPTLLACSLSQGLGIPVFDGTLVRSRFKKHQAGLPLDERLANVAGAFRLAHGAQVEGLRVLLVDDIITTGATAAACAAALLENGADSVFAAALASSQWQTDEKDEELVHRLD